MRSLWVALAAATIATGVSALVPGVSPLLWALLLGAITANTPMIRYGIVRNSQGKAKFLLRAGIVLFGASLSFTDLITLGIPGALIIGLTVLVVFYGTCWLGDRLKLERGLVTLIACGFAICGAAAIAAIEGAIKRRDEDVAVALAMVTLFGSLMILTVPFVGSVLGMSPQNVGVWAGASIHEVGQVVAAASVVGGASAMGAATVIKLGRVALLAVAFGASTWRHRADDASHEVGTGGLSRFLPWFLIGFLLMATARGVGAIPAVAISSIVSTGVFFLSAGMFGLGLSIRVKQLFPMRLGVLGLAAGSTALAALFPLALLTVLSV